MNHTSKVKGPPVGGGIGLTEGDPDGVSDGVTDGVWLGVELGGLPEGAAPREPELLDAQPAANNPAIRTSMMRRFNSILLLEGHCTS
jgi:hypothetical protein